MFIWTIGDIAAVIIFVIFIVAAVVERIDSAWYARPHKAEPKPAPKKPNPATRGDKIAYAVAILILVIVFFLWRFAHDNGL